MEYFYYLQGDKRYTSLKRLNPEKVRIIDLLNEFEEGNHTEKINYALQKYIIEQKNSLRKQPFLNKNDCNILFALLQLKKNRCKNKYRTNCDEEWTVVLLDQNSLNRSFNS